MSKPLELTVYPTFWMSGNLWTTAAAGATITEPIDVDYWVQCKRFTDAELAAEFWAAHGEANAAMTGNRRLFFSRRATLARFASLPHYDEDDA